MPPFEANRVHLASSSGSMEIITSVAGLRLAGARDKTRGGEQAARGRALMLPDAKVAVVQSETRVGPRLQQQPGIMTR